MEDYIKRISEKYGGTISIDSFKKTYTEYGEWINGKFQTTVTIQKLKVAFTIDYSTHSIPFTAAILLPGPLPEKCTIIPRKSILRKLFVPTNSLKNKYSISTDEAFLNTMKSKRELVDLLLENSTHTVIRKKDQQRLLVIRPHFSILSIEDFLRLEEITLAMIDCIVSPKLH